MDPGAGTRLRGVALNVGLERQALGIGSRPDTGQRGARLPGVDPGAGTRLHGVALNVGLERQALTLRRGAGAPGAHVQAWACACVHARIRIRMRVQIPHVRTLAGFGENFCRI